MLKPSIFAAFAIAATSAMPFYAFAQPQTADTVVATVDGQPITLGQMIVMKQSIQDPSMAEVKDPALWDMMLEQLIRQTAVATKGEENAGVRAQLELQRRNTLSAAAVNKIAEVEPTQEELEAAYKEIFAEEEPVTEYSAAHILVAAKEDADAIKKQLDEGADFGELAAEKSTDNSGPNKGDLGWFAAEQMVAPFAEAVKSMEKGQISDPVETQFGWHIIKLNDSRLREAPKLEEVRAELDQYVRRQKVETAIEDAVKNAKVEKVDGIDPALLSNVELLEAE